MKPTPLIISLALVLSACATKPEDISASYVSHTKYAHLSCSQLRKEAEAVSKRAASITAKQSKRRKQDNVAMGVSLILFWPAVFFVKGDGVAAKQLSNLKGDMQAIEETNRSKGCGIKFDT